MANVTLLVSSSCAACPSAKSLWKQMRVKHNFSYREIDISSPDGQELAERHSVRAVPASIINGRLTFVVCRLVKVSRKLSLDGADSSIRCPSMVTT